MRYNHRMVKGVPDTEKGWNRKEKINLKENLLETPRAPGAFQLVSAEKLEMGQMAGTSSRNW